jgi:hypothetical protein
MPLHVIESDERLYEIFLECTTRGALCFFNRQITKPRSARIVPAGRIPSLNHRFLLSTHTRDPPPVDSYGSMY